MANIERVKAVVEHIEKWQEAQKSATGIVNLLSFNMEDWYAEKKDANGNICGTTMCLAGWGAHFAGKKMVRAKNDANISDIFVEDTDVREEIESWAKRFFDFSDAETEIFYQTHIDDIEHLKSAINYLLDVEVFEGVKDYYELDEQ